VALSLALVAVALQYTIYSLYILSNIKVRGIEVKGSKVPSARSLLYLPTQLPSAVVGCITKSVVLYGNWKRWLLCLR